MLRTAVIGVGYLGRFHAQKYKQLTEQGKCQLVGVLDFDPARGRLVAEELGVKAFGSFDELKGHVDAVAVASTTKTHFELAKKALLAGFHTNVEKPMTVSLAEANELCQIAKEKKLVLAVGHSERFNPVFRDLAPKYAKAKFLEFRRHAPFKLRGSDVSVVLDLMIHDLDLALNWVKEDLKLVSAVGGRMHSETLDWAEAEFKTMSGACVRVSASRTASAMTRVVRGVEGLTNFTGNFQTMDVEELEWASGQEEPRRKRVETLAKADHLFLETEGFVSAIGGGALPWITGDQGRKALDLALQVEERISK